MRVEFTNEMKWTQYVKRERERERKFENVEILRLTKVVDHSAKCRVVFVLMFEQVLVECASLYGCIRALSASVWLLPSVCEDEWLADNEGRRCETLTRSNMAHNGIGSLSLVSAVRPFATINWVIANNGLPHHLHDSIDAVLLSAHILCTITIAHRQGNGSRIWIHLAGLLVIMSRIGALIMAVCTESIIGLLLLLLLVVLLVLGKGWNHCGRRYWFAQRWLAFHNSRGGGLGRRMWLVVLRWWRVTITRQQGRRTQ